MKSVICIGFAEAMAAVEVAWSLVDAGFEVVAFGRRGRRSALRHSRHVSTIEITPPESNCNAAVAELTRFLVSRRLFPQGTAVLLPLDDAAVWLFDQTGPQPGWIVAGPCDSNGRLALDKWLQNEAARAAGLLVPETTYATTVDDVFLRANQLPLVLKPAKAVFTDEARLRKGRSWICANHNELLRAVAEWRGAWPVLVQPFIRGVGEGVFGLATIDGIEAWSAHRRLRMMNPHGSGSSACVSIPVAEDLKLLIERFIRRTKWLGMFMIELLRDSNGAAWFIELNGRSWGSMALSRRQGLEYPAWAVDRALNPHSRNRVQLRGEQPVVCRNVGRECMHLLFLLQGPKSKALERWPSFWRTAIDVLRVHNGDSVYNWRKDDWRVFFWDCWYTVLDQVLKPRY
jgi:hypothetical protein